MKPLFEKGDGGNIFNVPESVIEKILDAAAAEGQDVRGFLNRHALYSVEYNTHGIILRADIKYKGIGSHGKTDRNQTSGN